jgi:hypothetical protein
MSEPQSTPGTELSSAVSGTLNLVTDAARRGAADASAAATRTWEATGRFLNRFVYTTCYTVAYGVVFPTVLLTRAIPRDNAAVRGLIEGASAARHKVDEVYHPALESPSGSPATALSSA